MSIYYDIYRQYDGPPPEYKRQNFVPKSSIEKTIHNLLRIIRSKRRHSKSLIHQEMLEYSAYLRYLHSQINR